MEGKYFVNGVYLSSDPWQSHGCYRPSGIFEPPTARGELELIETGRRVSEETRTTPRFM
jgi:hypothetical protein